MTNKIRDVSIQFVRYFGVALIGYAFDFGTLLFMSEILKIYYLLSASAGFMIGLIIIYILSNRFVFNKSRIKSKALEFGLFAIIGIIGLVILTIFMWLLTEKFSINYIISKIIATAFVYVWNFFARRSMYQA